MVMTNEETTLNNADEEIGSGKVEGWVSIQKNGLCKL